MNTPLEHHFTTARLSPVRFLAFLSVAICLCVSLSSTSAQTTTNSSVSQPGPNIFSVVPITSAQTGTNNHVHLQLVPVDDATAGLYKLPFEEVKKKAEGGDAAAMYQMALRFFRGDKGAPKSEEEGLKWLRKAAVKGFLGAQLSLASRYSKGDGVPQDLQEAAKWYRKAAEQGSAWLQQRTGERFFNGDGVPKDEAEGFKWFLKAAERGLANAQVTVGWSYHSGQGMPQDYAEAVKWFRKAAEQGNMYAQYDLGLCYHDGQGVPQDYAEAVKWFRKAAERGLAQAQSDLGLCYRFGHGVPQDYAEAVKWWRKAAEQGYASAQCNLGTCYENGHGVTQDYAEAVKWCRKAAEQGDAYGQYNLGLYYHNSYGVAQDYAEAVKWYRKAAEQGLAQAQSDLGLCYRFGHGVPQDYAEAVKWWRKAAEQGYAGAQYDLGITYETGQGVPQDYIEAYKWYNLAASQGDTNSVEGRDAIIELMTPGQIAEGQRRASAFAARKEGQAAGDATARPPFADIPTGSGTGFFVADSRVLTSYHVVNDANAIKIVSGSRVCTAKVVKADPANDLALLATTVMVGEPEQSQAGGALFPALPILSSRDIHLGDSVFTLGFPNVEVQGVEPKLTRGEINSLAGIQDDPRFVQMSVAVQPGNSGGALVDTRGNVVGIVTMRLDDLKLLEMSGSLPQNVNYALKSSFILAFLDTVPELAGKFKQPHTELNRKFEDIVKEVQQATVMVVVY
jgi:TPR repeat protein